MWDLSVPWWELIVRAVAVYGFLLILIRITGKRQIGQLAPFDLVLLLVLSNAVQNSMNAGDNSLVGGLLCATTLVALNFLVGWAAYRSKKLEGFIEGHPVVVIHNGLILEAAMAKTKLTHHELSAALRQAGYASPQGIHAAILENNGSISVIPHQAAVQTTAAKAPPSNSPE